MQSEYPKYLTLHGSLIGITERTLEVLSNVAQGTSPADREFFIAAELVSLAQKKKPPVPFLSLSESPTNEEKEGLLNHKDAYWREDGSRVVFLSAH